MQLGWQMVIPATGCVQEEGYLAAAVEGLVRPHQYENERPADAGKGSQT